MSAHHSYPIGDTGSRCPLCAGPVTCAFRGVGFDSISEQFAVMRCGACGVASTDPLLSDADLAGYYATDYYGGSGDERASQQKFVSWIERVVRFSNRRRGLTLMRLLNERHAPQDTKVLDVGCGRGVFLRELCKRGYDCTGVDIAPFGDERPVPFRFLRGPLRSHSLASASFDAASIWHVLEHLRDPQETLEELARVMRPGGVLCLAVPNFASTQARVFKEHWFHLDLPRHLFHFDTNNLRALVEQSGFAIVKQSSLAWAQNTYGAIQSLQNALLPPRHNNRLYALLKHRSAGSTSITAHWQEFAALGALAAASFPFALVEASITAVLGTGASAVMWARKR